MSITVSFSDENALKTALDAIRRPEDPTNWVLIGHEGDSANVVSVQGTGSGGFTELKSHLQNDQVQYALLRIFIKVDLSTTTKFVYVYNLGEKVPLMKKGRFGVVKGDVQRRFQPYHADIEIETPESWEEEEVMKKVSEGNTMSDLSSSSSGSHFPGKLPKFGQDKPASSSDIASSGSQTHLPGKLPKFGFDNSVTPSDAPSSGSQNPLPGKLPKFGQDKVAPPPGQPLPSLPAKKALGSGVVGGGSKGPTFTPELIEAIKAVHSDKSPADWVLATYEDNSMSRPITLLGTGEGGADELKKQLSTDKIFYGLVRVIDMIDAHPTVKFALLVFVGNDVSIMKKAQTTTHKGAVETQFQPFHLSMNVSELSEISSDLVLSSVQSASGSKSHVK
ncbi:hypothetical protein HDU93_001683 [Gonapodya sp. JEL0774]|nr:hypothetical protein HDU93_001683 [Gonapodya sp. JEL0774]